MAGLRPAHFVSMATPHFGCDTEGVPAVPFIRWSGDVPLVGASLLGLLEGISHAASKVLLARTGEQFFMLDGSGGREGKGGGNGQADGALTDEGAAFGVGAGDQPLLFQMTGDVPDKGLYFYSALAAFRSRTAYANTDGERCLGGLGRLGLLAKETCAGAGSATDRI